MNQAAVLILLLISCGHAVAASVHGVVTSDSDAPIAYVNVSLHSLDQPLGEALTALANEWGEYRFENVPSGEYRLQVRSISCPAWDGSLSVHEDSIELSFSIECPRVTGEEVRFFGEPSRAIADVIKSASHVQTFTIDPEKLGAQAGGEMEATIGGYPIVARGRDLTGQAAKAASSVLLSEESYRLDFPHNVKFCMFWPHHALRFVHGSERVDVVVCFSCNQLRFAGGGGGDFDYATEELARLFERVGLLVN